MKLKPKPSEIFRETSINTERNVCNGVRQTFDKKQWLQWIAVAEEFKNDGNQSIFECGIINWQRSCTKIIGK